VYRGGGIRVCNGSKFGDENGQFTFYNHLGSSVIGYVLIDEHHYDLVSEPNVCPFNEWSDHVPITFKMKLLSE